SRPFYVVAHNPNSFADADNALAAGANALEPDIQNLHGCHGYQHKLVVQHDDPCGISGLDDDTPTLEDYLDHVHQLALQYPEQLALVMLDVKPESVSPESGDEIIKAIRQHLNWGGVDVPVIISVAEIQPGGQLFDHILSWNLGPREGVQIDEQDFALDVVDFFYNLGYTGNIAYG